MDRKGLFNNLLNETKLEANCFELLTSSQIELCEAIENKNWHLLNKAMAKVKKNLLSIEEAEAKRNLAFENFNKYLSQKFTHYSELRTKLEAKEIEALDPAHARLKVCSSIAKLQIEQGAQLAKSSKNLLSDMMGELFPQKKHGLYSGRGKIVEPNLDALIFDKNS